MILQILLQIILLKGDPQGSVRSAKYRFIDGTGHSFRNIDID